MPGRLANVQGTGDLPLDEGRIDHRGKLDEPGAVPVAVEEFRGGLEHHTGLAGPTDAHERDRPMILEQPADLGEFALAAHEGGHLDRQVRAMRFKRAERREFRCEASRPDLEHPLREIEITQPVLASIYELVPVGSRVRKERPAGAGDKDLATVADREQPGDAVEDGPEIVVVAALGGARVNRHPHPERTRASPVVRGERSLSFQRRADRGAHRVEHGEQPVPGGLDDDAAGVPDHGCQQPIVRLERGCHRLVVIFPEAGAALDVRDQERTRHRGPIDHVGLSSGGRAAAPCGAPR